MNTGLIIAIIVSILIPVIITIIVVLKKDNSNVVRLPKWIPILATMITSFGGFVVAHEILTGSESNETIVAISIMTILFLWATLYCLVTKIEFYEEYFVYRNMFFIKKKYSYEAITGIKYLQAGTFKIIVGRKKMEVSGIATNYFNICGKLKKEGIFKKYPFKEKVKKG